ncbi:hypothetical protein [Microbacterium candidum]|uniref:Uncharacterized protein n=1 Tax=Microbacterium candidum TaxID=3041922 RepID=A0ABT7MY98_9MICO|nr:hypothetical protein [Microbacterium sp. ASV49]MDL9979424.1 hypothetical protein [Microbacterium sp. ASV49]
MIGPDWTPHRRDDGELVGWIRPDGDDWIAIDLFGHEVSAPMDWLDAEAVLEDRGISWLADIWMLETDAGALRVRLVEVTPERIVVQTDDYGAIDAPVERFELPWPAPAHLRPRRHDDPDGRVFHRSVTQP